MFSNSRTFRDIQVLYEPCNTFNFDAKLPCLVAPGGSGALYFFDVSNRGRLALAGTGMPEVAVLCGVSKTKKCYLACLACKYRMQNACFCTLRVKIMDVTFELSIFNFAFN